jgi:hypothetical protein
MASPEERVQASHREAQAILEVSAATKQKPFDLVIECSGAESSIQTGILILKKRGTFVQVSTSPHLIYPGIDSAGRKLRHNDQPSHADGGESSTHYQRLLPGQYIAGPLVVLMIADEEVWTGMLPKGYRFG